MKIDLVSDLHLEFGACDIPETDNSILVLAGDIHVGDRAVDWITRAVDHYDLILYVLGNHEFYHHEYNAVREAWADLSTYIKPLRVLDNDVVEVDGTRFVGSTLWTAGSQSVLNDFVVIRRDNHVLNTWDTREIHEQAVQFLTDILSTDYAGKTVVITHHAPVPECVRPRWVGSPINEMFHAYLGDLIVEYSPDLWLHGHMHDSVDIVVGDTRIVCNPRGYVGHDRNAQFENPKILEI